MKAVRLLQKTLEDIEKGRNFYNKQAEGLGDRFVEATMREIGSLAEKHGFHSRYRGYYKMIGAVFPFGVYYDIYEDTVRVVAVFDLRAKPSSIQSKLRSRGSE